MTERYDQETILGYVEGELTDDQRARFEAILADDHELRQLVSQMKLDRQALRGLGTQSAPVGLIDQVIQVHERAALLGDPTAPEPLPLSMPVSRWKLGRVLAYSGIAAVLLLSFGLVLQTLIPPGLLSYNPQLAQNEAGSDTSGTSPDVGSGLALLDEDTAYDEADVLTRRSSATEDDRQAAPGSTLESTPGSTPGFTPGATLRSTPGSSPRSAPVSGIESDISQAIVSERLALSDDSEAVAGKPAMNEREDELSSALAMKAAAADASRMNSIADTVGSRAREESAPKSSPSDITIAGSVLAKAEHPEETNAFEFKKDASVGAFAGYLDTPLTDDTQLLIKSASPTQAHRDIRNWALDNSVRLIEEPLAGLSVGEGVGGAVAGRLARTGATPAAEAIEIRDAASTRYIVVVEEQQVPQLLAYLNRDQGQHAELVTQTKELAEADQASVSGMPPVKRMAKQDIGTEPADNIADPVTGGTADDAVDPPKATANRLVDTHTGWDQGALVRGLTTATPATEKNNAPEPVEARKESDDRGKQLDESPGKPTRLPTAYDWSRLLEPKQPFTLSPAHAPLPEPQARSPLRLEIIIQQVADESPPVIDTDETSQVEQEATGDITE